MSRLRQKLAAIQSVETDVMLDEDTVGVGQKLADGLQFVIKPMYIEGYAHEDDIDIKMRMTNGDTVNWSYQLDASGNVMDNTLTVNGQAIKLSNVRTESYKEVIDEYAKKINF